MNSIFLKVEPFLNHYCSSSLPILLALSGGADSLCLFYCLLTYRKQKKIPFHVAHVNHGWRQESQGEAQILQELALEHGVPFHLKVLDPKLCLGNLEASCRKERYLFFSELSKAYLFQCILTGHHQNDQAETIFKRILEGAHWSRWQGLKPETWIEGSRILRPLLQVSKQAIQKALAASKIQHFDDPSNRQLHFLRAKFRESLFPRLNQEFGKEVQQSFIEIGEETQELINYFEGRLTHLLKKIKKGPWGIYLALQSCMPSTILEIKYLLRHIVAKENFFLSRTILDQASKALKEGKANCRFAMGKQQIFIDRGSIFILSQRKNEYWAVQTLSRGKTLVGNWLVEVKEDVPISHIKSISWKEGWEGILICHLPIGNYQIGLMKHLYEPAVDLLGIKKRWSQAKVPAFLYEIFPLILKGSSIYHEFLTGKPLTLLKGETICWKVTLTFQG